MGSQNSENSGSMDSETFANFWGPQAGEDCSFAHFGQESSVSSQEMKAQDKDKVSPSSMLGGTFLATLQGKLKVNNGILCLTEQGESSSPFY